MSGEAENQVKKKVLAGETLEGVGKDQLETLKRELQEQETLISGYQQVQPDNCNIATYILIFYLLLSLE